MKNKIAIILIIIASFSLLHIGCGKKEESGPIVAKINDYQMTAEDLNDKIAHSPYSREMARNLDEFLDLAIREQVLIQEAQRQGLDREKTFMRTIERYWVQTLIKELLDKQSRKIYEGMDEDQREAAMERWLEELYKKADIKIYREVLEEMKKVK